MTRFHALQLLAGVLLFTLLGEPACSGQVPSAGTKIGWVYYGLLTSKPGVAEKWQDLSFVPATPGAGAQASAIPVANMPLKTIVNTNMRSDSISVSPTGAVQYPPITGIVTLNTPVTVLEIKTFPSGQGVHYWIKVQR